MIVDVLMKHAKRDIFERTLVAIYTTIILLTNAPLPLVAPSETNAESALVQYRECDFSFILPI